MRSSKAQDIRYNIVDPRGAVSFVGPAHLGKMLAAGAAESPQTVVELLERVQHLDTLAFEAVRHGLLTFDEFVLDEDHVDLDAWRARVGEIERQPFRVLDAELRELSLRPAELGLTIVNLVDRRIIQIEDRYGRIERQDRGRVRTNGRPVGRYYQYALPDDWTILP
jgi:hypothetical protein